MPAFIVGITLLILAPRPIYVMLPFVLISLGTWVVTVHAAYCWYAEQLIKRDMIGVVLPLADKYRFPIIKRFIMPTELELTFQLLEEKIHAYCHQEELMTRYVGPALANLSKIDPRYQAWSCKIVKSATRESRMPWLLASFVTHSKKLDTKQFILLIPTITNDREVAIKALGPSAQRYMNMY